jgi:hypothetical protein
MINKNNDYSLELVIEIEIGKVYNFDVTTYMLSMGH